MNIQAFICNFAYEMTVMYFEYKVSDYESLGTSEFRTSQQKSSLCLFELL